MKKMKGNEIFKTITASVLSIGLFSAAFMGMNNLAFAAATNKTETIPTVTTSVNLPVAEVKLPEGYKKAALTVYESADSHKRSTQVIPMQEAADIGAQYIWEMFGENIDGKVVEMDYRAYPFNTRTWWIGAVADSKSDLENHEAIYRFTIDAISGERIDIDKDWSGSAASKENEKTITFEQFEQLIEAYRNQNHDEYIQVAKDYAQKHFTNSKVVSAVYHSMSPKRIGRDRNTITYNPKDNEMSIIVTDNTGCEATVRIVIETKQLLSISTQENDIVPGFDAYVPGGLG